MQLEVGKTYVRRDGRITKIIRKEDAFPEFPYIGVTRYEGDRDFRITELSYTERGEFYGPHEPYGADLVSEAPVVEGYLPKMEVEG